MKALQRSTYRCDTRTAGTPANERTCSKSKGNKRRQSPPVPTCCDPISLLMWRSTHSCWTAAERKDFAVYLAAGRMPYWVRIHTQTTQVESRGATDANDSTSIRPAAAAVLRLLKSPLRGFGATSHATLSAQPSRRLRRLTTLAVRTGLLVGPRVHSAHGGPFQAPVGLGQRRGD